MPRFVERPLQPRELRIDHCEHEPTAGLQLLPYRGQGTPLVFGCKEQLERAESDDHERESSRQGEVDHVSRDELHPLADRFMELGVAAALARAAACHLDAGDSRAASTTSAARLSATRSALAAAYTAHQLFGAVGITLEGDVFHVSRRIRQLASQPPGDTGARATLLSELGI